MKIIEAMKKWKDLEKKAEDLRAKIGQYCADLSIENPVYPNQAQTVRGWLQAHEDITREIASLRTCIVRTNLATSVTIQLGGKSVTKTIYEWVLRRQKLAEMDRLAWVALTDRGLRDQQITNTNGNATPVTVRRYFDPKERDDRVEIYRSEPAAIDAALEVVNATTEITA